VSGSEEVINDSSVPNVAEEQTLERQQLAIFPRSGIEFDANWTFSRVEQKLRECLPVLFEYFDTLEPRYFADDGDFPEFVGEQQPQWGLLFKKRSTLIFVSSAAMPNGGSIQRNSAPPKAGLSRCKLYLGANIS